MKHRSNGGFSLIETLVAITILALIVIPVGSSFVLAFRMNAKTEAMMQAQLAVSSAVETLMAEGITEASNEYAKDDTRFDKVTIATTKVNGEPYYKVTVYDGEEESSAMVSVNTFIRAVEKAEQEGSVLP